MFNILLDNWKDWPIVADWLEECGNPIGTEMRKITESGYGIKLKYKKKPLRVGQQLACAYFYNLLQPLELRLRTELDIRRIIPINNRRTDRFVWRQRQLILHGTVDDIVINPHGIIQTRLSFYRWVAYMDLKYATCPVWVVDSKIIGGPVSDLKTEVTNTTCPDTNCRGDCIIDRQYEEDHPTDNPSLQMWKCTRCKMRWLGSILM